MGVVWKKVGVVTQNFSTCSARTLLKESTPAMTCISLVPRPFPPLVFDCLQCAKTEREGLGKRVMCVTSGRREGRQKGGSA